MKQVKMKFKNEDGVEIEKLVPENLVSNYEMIGWEIVKSPKAYNKLNGDTKNKNDKDL